MGAFFARRAILASLAGVLTLAIIGAAFVTWSMRTPQSSYMTQYVTSGGYQAILAPPSGTRLNRPFTTHGSSAPSGASVTFATGTTATTTDDGMAVGPTTPVQQNQVGSIYLTLTLKNTGTTTWTSSGGYLIHCVSNCGTTSDWPTGTIAPGNTGVVQPQMAIPAPFSSSTTEVQWVLEHNGVIFGSPINISITQTVAQPLFDPVQDPQPWCATPVLWGMTQLSSTNTVTCSSAGTVLQTAGGVGPGLWLAKPPLTWNKASYRMRVHAHFDSVPTNAQTNPVWMSLLMNVYTSSLCPYDRVDFSPGNGVMHYGLSAPYCNQGYSPTRVWTAESVGQDTDIGVIVSGNALSVWVNGAVEYTAAYTGGSVALALGSATGQPAQVTLTNFELDNNIGAYTTYVLG